MIRIALATLAAVTCTAFADTVGASPDAAYGKIPVYFEQNKGQVASGVEFIARLGSGTVYLTKGEAVTVLRSARKSSSATRNEPLGFDEAVVRTRLIGASTSEVRGLDPMEGVSHYYIGSDPAQWHTSVPHFGRVQLRQVYPGVDLVYYPGKGSLEYDFVLSPGADPGQVKLGFTGADSVEIQGNGDLLLRTRLGNIYHRKPLVYQNVDGRRVTVEARYRVHKETVGFDLGDYRAELPLIIDPIVNYSSYIGGSGSDAVADVATDGTNAYVVGTTGSANFPPGSIQGTSDAFVARINSAGTALTWAVYLGGASTETGTGIVYSTSGNVFVTGTTKSTTLPATTGAAQTTNRGFDEAFVAKLNSSSGVIVRSSFYGGNGQDFAFGIALDTSGGPVIVGQSGSSNLSLPSAHDNTLSGLGDGFIASFDSNLQTQTFGTLVGGTGFEELRAVAVSNTNVAIVGGTTENGLAVVSPIQATYGGGPSDGLWARFNLTTKAVETISYLGGSGTDEINGVAADAVDAGYLTGRTTSSSFPHTTPGSFDVTHNGSGDIFLVKITGTTQINYGTFLGGSGDETGLAIRVDGSRNAVLVGSSSSSGFPTYNANQPFLRGARDAVIAKINPAGTALVYSTFFGGSGAESAQGVALASSEPFLAGATDSTDLTVVSPFDSTANGGLDGFAAKFTQGPPPIAVTFATNPAGLRLVIDGATYTTPVTLGWAVGVSHTVNAENPQFQQPDQAFSWQSWDAPLTTSAQSQTVVTPGAPTTYTANFSVQTCTYSVSPNPAGIGLTGGSLPISVSTTGTCPWIATPVDTWITGGGVVQTGSGTANLTVAPSAFARNGTATVAFQTVNVAQSLSQGPTVLEPMPAFGSGTNQTFTFRFEDPNGAADLNVLNVIVKNVLDGRTACYIAYVTSGPTTGTMFLVNDAGDAGGPFAGSLPIPSTGTIGNSQCTINGTGSSASMSGNRLTLNVNMTFTAALAGNMVIYQAARDQAANNSGWVTKGVWNIPLGPPSSPGVVSMSPQRVTGSSLTLVTTFSDNDGFADLNIVNILINNAIDGRQACYIAFVRPTGDLLLVNDAGDAGGPFAGNTIIPGGGTVSNSQCTINAAASSVSGSGNNLTLTLSISFTPAFKGDRIIYVAPRDVAENNPGWQSMGTVTVP